MSWSEGLAAFALLAAAQFVVTTLSRRLRVMRGGVTSEPTLLVRDGVLLPDVLDGQRVTESEVRQSIRGSGVGGLDQVAAVVLETDGSLSVVTRSATGDHWALDDVAPEGQASGVGNQ